MSLDAISLRTADIARVAGIKPRQVHAWIENDVFRNAIAELDRNGERQYTKRDAIKLRILADLTALGITASVAGEAAHRLAEEMPLGVAHLGRRPGGGWMFLHPDDVELLIEAIPAASVRVNMDKLVHEVFSDIERRT